MYIHEPTAGTWTVRVKGALIPNGRQPFALVMDGNLVQHAPVVQSITPVSALNAGMLDDALVAGSYLLGATSVRLFKDPATIPGVISANGDTQLKVDFDLTGKSPGVYDLVVTTPSGTGTLPAAFTVLDATLPDLKLALASEKFLFFTGEPITFTLRLENDSLIDGIFERIVGQGLGFIENIMQIFA